MPIEDARNFFDQLDTAGNGVVDYNEFAAGIMGEQNCSPIKLPFECLPAAALVGHRRRRRRRRLRLHLLLYHSHNYVRNLLAL